MTIFFTLAALAIVGLIGWNYFWPLGKEKIVAPPPRPGDNV